MTMHDHNFEPSPGGASFEQLTAEFAVKSLALGVPVEVVGKVMIGTALEVWVRELGLDGAKAAFADVAAMFADYHDEPLQ